jgi:hypothetical protein
MIQARRDKMKTFRILAAAVAGLAFAGLAQAAGGAIDEAAPLWFKLQQTVMSYGMYAWQLFVGGGHAVLYPIPAGLQVPTAWVFAVGAGLLGATAVAVNSWRTRPWLFAGWFWFVLVTFPMSGMVTIGEHSHADRYTYLPHLVLLAALVRQLRAWGWLEDSRTRVQCVAWAAVVAFCITLAVVTTAALRLGAGRETVLAIVLVTAVACFLGWRGTIGPKTPWNEGWNGVEQTRASCETPQPRSGPRGSGRRPMGRRAGLVAPHEAFTASVVHPF